MLVNSIDAFWVVATFVYSMPYMHLLTILVAALFSAVALSATLSCVNYFAFHTGLTCRRVVMLRGCPPGRDPAPFRPG